MLRAQPTGAFRPFPPGFLWGTATSAYQIEGAATADGRGPSIWDVFSRQPGAIADGANGDVAADHYHRFEQDVDLMRALGAGAYRFSISWPRVQPAGSGPVNPRGLDFYRRLVDRLLRHGIVPFPTLYHWDLPAELEERGGWRSRDTAERFVDYASLVCDALGDRVTHWITLNEPWCSAFLGYCAGVHAPGVTDEKAGLKAAHHLLLAHGGATSAMRSSAPGAKIGITLNLFPIEAATAAPEDRAAARLIDGLQNRIFLDPLFRASYPDDVLDHYGKLCDLSFIADGDLTRIAAPMDHLGVNYYDMHRVRAHPRTTPGPSPWPGAQHVDFVPPAGVSTAMGWGIEPDALSGLLLRLNREYTRLPMYITENGAAFEDRVESNGAVFDAERLRFLRRHVTAIHRAMSQGVDVRGYFVWSLLDNFEWAHGYSKRFGIVHVDFETQRRTPKASARWYSEVMGKNGLMDGADGVLNAGNAESNGAQPTLEAVASLAGVSRSTVSRVINGSPRVSERARAAVEDAIKRLGYVPNRAARSLVTRRTNTVALVVPEAQSRFFSEPFFGGIVRGVSQALADSPFQLVLSMPHGTRQSERFQRYVMGGHADGVLIVSFHASDVLLQTLLASRVPIVLGGRPVTDLGVSYDDADNRGGAQLAAHHLLERGRTTVATITGPTDMAAGLDRLQGYRDALAGAGHEPDPSLEEIGDFSQDSGHRAMQALLRRRPDLDAVFAASDLMAAGALRVLAAAGRRVPEDVAVVGFDDSDAALLATPPLTTVRQPMEDMGRRMATMLLERITGGNDEPTQVVVDTELVIRSTT